MANHFDDKKLVNQLLRGDEAAFDRFFDDNFARLYRFVVRRLPEDPDAARDIAQVTLTKAVRNLKSYRGEAALFTWLCAICRNELTDWRRRNGRHRDHLVFIEDHAEVRAVVESLEAPPDERPDRMLRRQESLRLIQVALDRLPARYGNVLEWKYIEGRSVKEIAGQLQLGTEATQSLLARARRAFAEVYSAMMIALDSKSTDLVQR